MRRRILSLGLLALASVPQLGAQQLDTASPGKSIIVVTGSASKSVAPDAVTIRLLVSSLEKRPGEAADVVDEKSTAVVQAIEALGVADLTISSIGYGVGPQWDYTADRERKFRGYRAQVTIKVETGSLDETGRIVEAGLTSGAGQMQGVRYTSTRMDQARRDALRAAVDAARLDASAMAEAAGGTLGRLLLLTTERADPPPGIRLQAGTVAMSAGATDRRTQGIQITPEDLTVTARVESRWLFSSPSFSE